MSNYIQSASVTWILTELNIIKMAIEKQSKKKYDASRSITEPIAKKIISRNDLQNNSNNYVHKYSDITKKKAEYYQSVIAILR